ncbi:MAG: hypothetical protein K2Y71_04730 [Xanthobacteraceae bacterium]|nr:hypothetical protein [Xanthobacteraceae bacterium]
MDVLGALAFAMLMVAQLCAVIALHDFDFDDSAGGDRESLALTNYAPFGSRSVESARPAQPASLQRRSEGADFLAPHALSRGVAKEPPPC